MKTHVPFPPGRPECSFEIGAIVSTFWVLVVVPTEKMICLIELHPGSGVRTDLRRLGLACRPKARRRPCLHALPEGHLPTGAEPSLLPLWAPLTPAKPPERLGLSLPPPPAHGWWEDHPRCDRDWPPWFR